MWKLATTGLIFNGRYMQYLWKQTGVFAGCLVTGLSLHSMALQYKCLKWSAILVPSQANKLFKTMDNFQCTPFSRITWNLASRRTSQPWEVHSVSLHLSWSSAVMATKDLGGYFYSLQQIETLWKHSVWHNISIPNGCTYDYQWLRIWAWGGAEKREVSPRKHK